MTLSMQQASRPVFLRQLRALDVLLEKGAAFAAAEGIAPEELAGARLAPDMFPLIRQVQIATDMAKGCAARLAGREVPSWPDEEKDFADLRARVGKAIAFIGGIDPDAIDGSEERAIHLKFPQREFEFQGDDYLLHFAMPHFYFHVSMVYALLRAKGVPVGKMDYIGQA